MRKIEYVLRVTMAVDRDIDPDTMQQHIYEYTSFVSRNTSIASIIKEEAVSLTYIDKKSIKNEIPTIAYLETYYLVVAEIEAALKASTRTRHPNKEYIRQEYSNGGMGRMWELAKQYTDEFEELHQNTDWDTQPTDWQDTLWVFMGKKIKGDV